MPEVSNNLGLIRFTSINEFLIHIAEHTLWKNIKYSSFCGLTDFVIKTACAVAFACYRVGTVGNIADMLKPISA